MGWFGGIVGGVAGAVGGPIGVVGGAFLGSKAEDSINGGGGGSPSPTASPAQPDYSPVMAYMSDNNKTVAMAQIRSQENALLQASADRQAQLAANLELGLEKMDVSLQTRKLEFMQQMTAEQNHHAEKLAEIGVKLQGLEQSRSGATNDIPAPDFA